jgi:predicted proteasome-type protease
MLCVRFAQSMARHSTQVKQAFMYRVFWAVRWAMKPPRLFQIYDEGNFIEATDDTPYLQIGEHKYGKPILDRVVHPEMRLGEVAKLILLSFDATLRSNLSVGMPIDLLLYERDTLDATRAENRRE